MKIIVPMAGMGKRMRPHTHTTAKPLLPIAGKPIVQRLVEDLAAVAGEAVEEVAFVTNPAFGKTVEDELVSIAEAIGAKGTIHYQETALGTAHAILCAQSALSGRVIVAFADTLFRAQLKLDKDCDGVIWVNKVEDPKPFGVVKLDDKGIITEFVEKPQTFISDLAIIGIYYFADGEYLRKEMQYLIDNDIKDKGEYQLTNAMENMKQKGARFKAGSVDVWMDCGNKNAMVDTNTKVLGFLKDDKNLVSKSLKSTNSVVIPPCFIGEDVTLTNSIVGPNVSIEMGASISGSVVKNSILRSNTRVQDCVLDNSMIGERAMVSGTALDVSMSDDSTFG
ncbi:MAG: NTP transferase domain-containing protein [Flavobacteriales bacterium]|jgi:glucose-1-phosphate thymidylyltransferase|nr:NTP transferase domain-containing protein [Flavobacteriales bacterium]MBK7113640.1 NTP transferase domain-containing protein [Flavobacteriales bacterium]MBK7619871.1 NTP transferase domain-containing protein [Flavobacteriales bacterium]MBK8531002.1 NTP transferase domain-containing protein [Flavobacteriales bacterium]MCC6911598.1 NTP transferase domain-containing protein [Flavobacteriales bacterium]